MPSEAPITPVALVGARGYVGAELVRLVARHPALRLTIACSHALAGERVDAALPGAPAGLLFEHPSPRALAQRCAAGAARVVVLALPNTHGAEYVRAIDDLAPGTIVLDLSADHRVEPEWVYGLPEHFRERLAGSTRIANPGCYATAAQLALRPVVDLIASEPVCFGLSGFSGAGHTPSDKNNPEILRDGALAYSLTGHAHETEISMHLGVRTRLLPHVGPFFRGLSVTAALALREPISLAALLERYERAYASCPLVRVLGEASPVIHHLANTPGAAVGGISLGADGTTLAVVAALDNLLKGAASQAVQNLNLALGLDELTGLHP